QLCRSAQGLSASDKQKAHSMAARTHKEKRHAPFKTFATAIRLFAIWGNFFKIQFLASQSTGRARKSSRLLRNRSHRHSLAFRAIRRESVRYLSYSTF